MNMRMIEQMEEVLRLLVEAKLDLQDWVDALELDDNYSKEAINETEDLIGKIETVLHEIGA